MIIRVIIYYSCPGKTVIIPMTEIAQTHKTRYITTHEHKKQNKGKSYHGKR
jgi:hypothetical protein